MPYKDREQERTHKAAYRLAHLAERRAYDVAWRLQNAERKKATDRAYYETHREQVMARSLEYQRRHLDEVTARTLRRYHDDPAFRTRCLARQALNNAVTAGKIVRPTICQECGNVTKVTGHHDDYTTPLAVRWLCRACHRSIHRSLLF